MNDYFYLKNNLDDHSLIAKSFRKEFLSSRVNTLNAVFEYTFSCYSTVLLISKIIHFWPFFSPIFNGKFFRVSSYTTGKLTNDYFRRKNNPDNDPLIAKSFRKEFLSSRVLILNAVFGYTFSRYETVLFLSKIIHFRPFFSPIFNEKFFRVSSYTTGKLTNDYFRRKNNPGDHSLIAKSFRKEFLSSRVLILNAVFGYTFSCYSTVLLISKIIHFRPFFFPIFNEKFFRVSSYTIGKLMNDYFYLKNNLDDHSLIAKPSRKEFLSSRVLTLPHRGPSRRKKTLFLDILFPTVKWYFFYLKLSILDIFSSRFLMRN
jgi:hypothetical protein